MATAIQLESGTWFIRVYSHKDASGKRVYRSFTASTRREVESKASKFMENKERSNCVSMTVKKCIDDYITVKTPDLSPSTIRSYRNLQKKYYKGLENKDIKKLTNADVQKMLNELKVTTWTNKKGEKEKLSYKSRKNIYALFAAAIKFYAKDIEFDVEVKKDDKPDEITMEDYQNNIQEKLPSPDEVVLLFKAAYPWLQKCIALAAFSGMRRGEIAALRYKDIVPGQNKLFIHTAYAMDENNKWVLKPPKTEGSIRFVNVPPQIIELLGTGDPEEFIIGYNPNTISKMFIKLRDNMGVDVTFHQLRHFYASIGNVLHIPDTVLADFGGWEHNSPIIKGTYQNNIKDISEGYAKKMNDYFSDIINEDKKAK